MIDWCLQNTALWNLTVTEVLHIFPVSLVLFSRFRSKCCTYPWNLAGWIKMKPQLRQTRNVAVGFACQITDWSSLCWYAVLSDNGFYHLVSKIDINYFLLLLFHWSLVSLAELLCVLWSCIRACLSMSYRKTRTVTSTCTNRVTQICTFRFNKTKTSVTTTTSLVFGPGLPSQPSSLWSSVLRVCSLSWTIIACVSLSFVVWRARKRWD